MHSNIFYNGVALKAGQVWLPTASYLKKFPGEGPLTVIPRKSGDGARPLDITDKYGFTYESIPLSEVLNGYELDAPKDERMLVLSPHEVLVEISDERARQDRKWGTQNHGPAVWLMILSEEFGEAAREINDFHFLLERTRNTREYDPDAVAKLKEYLKKMRTELIQTAAVAVAMIESLDRNEAKQL